MTGGLRLEYATSKYSVVYIELILSWETAIMRGLKGSLFPFFNTQVENLYIYSCQFYVAKDFRTMSTRPLLITVFSALPVSRRPKPCSMDEDRI